MALAFGSAALATAVAVSMKWHPREAEPERAAESKISPVRTSVVTMSTANTVTSIDVVLPAAPLAAPTISSEVPLIEKRATPRRPQEAPRRTALAPSATPPTMSAARAPSIASGLAVELDNPYEHK
jgi:hypothetical protein